MILISAVDCNQAMLNISSNYTQKCAPAAEVARVVQAIKMYMVFENSFVKDTDFVDPIQKSLQNYQFISAANHSVGQYMKISENIAKLYDSWLFGDPKVLNYYETKIDNYVV